MTELSHSVLSISVALIIVGFIIKLAPAGKGQRSIKWILSLIIVLIITAPLTSAVNVETNFDISSEQVTSNRYNNLIENTTINLLKSRIKTVLKNNNLSYNYVDIVEIKGVDSVKIGAITVYVDGEGDITKIKTAVRKELQLDVAVAVEKR